MRILLWGFFKEKTSVELCRAKSTWKESLLFFSMTSNCKIIAALLYFFMCVKTWGQEEMPCTGAGLERRTKVAAGILQADLSWLGHSLFQSIHGGTSSPTKILPSSAAQLCWRPDLHRTVPLSMCCWLGELVLLQCHPCVNSTLRKVAAAQLVQCWGPLAVIN